MVVFFFLGVIILLDCLSFNFKIFKVGEVGVKLNDPYGFLSNLGYSVKCSCVQSTFAW